MRTGTESRACGTTSADRGSNRWLYWGTNTTVVWISPSMRLTELSREMSGVSHDAICDASIIRRTSP